MYFMGAYRQALESALKAKEYGLKDAILLPNVDYILKQSPIEMRKLLEEKTPRPAGQQP
jgi:hypothetical protein